MSKRGPEFYSFYSGMEYGETYAISGTIEYIPYTGKKSTDDIEVEFVSRSHWGSWETVEGSSPYTIFRIKIPPSEWGHVDKERTLQHKFEDTFTIDPYLTMDNGWLESSIYVGARGPYRSIIVKNVMVVKGTKPAKWTLSKAEGDDPGIVLSSAINMSHDQIQLVSDSIVLEGYTTINSNFWVDGDGNMGAIGGTIGGIKIYKDGIGFENGTFRVNSAKNSVSLPNNTYLNGRKIATSQGLPVTDTRNNNSPPSWYYDKHPNRTVEEFKLRKTIGAPGSGTYVSLATHVKWGDPSGGAMVQVAYGEDGKIHTRRASGSSGWSGWSQLAQAKPDQPMQDYVIDEGTVGIWWYRRWSNGKMECWGYTSLLTLPTSKGGWNLYTTNHQGGYNFPRPFTNKPLLTAMWESESYNAWIMKTSPVTNSHTGNFQLLRGSAGTLKGRIHIHAYGWWR